MGIDSHRGYYIGIGGTLFVGRMNYDYAALGSTPIPGGTPLGQFFHVTAKVSGCNFEVSAKRANTNDAAITLTVSDPGCPASGAIAVRDAGGNASFRDIRVNP